MARIALSLTVALIGSSFVAAQGKAEKEKESKPAKVTAAQAVKDAEHALEVLPQLHLAAQNFQDAYGKPLPTDKGLRGDKPNYLGWRFFLLPFIEQDNLYRQFRLDEPWDSPHNKKLLARRPKVYAPRAGTTKVEDGTFYRVFTGQDAPFNPATTRRGPQSTGRPLPVAFPDGTSNTYMVVEAAEVSS